MLPEGITIMQIPPLMKAIVPLVFLLTLLFWQPVTTSAAYLVKLNPVAAYSDTTSTNVYAPVSETKIRKTENRFRHFLAGRLTAHYNKGHYPGDGSGMGTTSLVMGILGFFVFPLSILAIVFGAKGLKAKNGDTGLARTGLILGIIGTAYYLVAIALIILFLSIL